MPIRTLPAGGGAGWKGIGGGWWGRMLGVIVLGSSRSNTCTRRSLRSPGWTKDRGNSSGGGGRCGLLTISVSWFVDSHAPLSSPHTPRSSVHPSFLPRCIPEQCGVLWVGRMRLDYYYVPRVCPTRICCPNNNTLIPIVNIAK